MRDDVHELAFVMQENEERPHDHRVPVCTPCSPKAPSVGAANRTLCTCGTCEECQLRAFMLAQGPKRGWKQLPYSACSAVAEGGQYWQVFAVTHTVGDLRLLKEALLQAGQQEMEPPELHTRDNTPEPSEESSFRAANLWG